MPRKGSDDDAAVRADLQLLGEFLARRDVPELSARALGGRADVLALCGSAVLPSVALAATALRVGVVGRLVVTGGRGHSTDHLADAVGEHPRYRDVPTTGRSEAAVLGEILRRHHGVPAALITLEERSTNCGENARFTLDVLAEQGRTGTLLLVQDPTMQRRTHASFARCAREDGADLRLVSYAPLVPVVGTTSVTDVDGARVWSRDRFEALVRGEIRRLHDDESGYGPHGRDFIDHVDVPPEALAAARRLEATGPGRAREAWRP